LAKQRIGNTRAAMVNDWSMEHRLSRILRDASLRDAPQDEDHLGGALIQSQTSW
jgi:hypothetical protein